MIIGRGLMGDGYRVQGKGVDASLGVNRAA